MIRRIFDDVDAFAGALAHLNARFMLLEPRRAPWELCQVVLGGAVVQWGAPGAAHVCEGVTSIDVTTFLLPLANTGAISANGVQMDDRSLLLLGPGGEFCLASDGVCRWVALAIPRHLLAPPPGSEALVRAGASHARRLAPDAVRLFRSTLDGLFAAASEDPAPSASSPAPTTVVRSLAQAAAAVLAVAAGRQVGRRAIPRPGIVRRAVDHLCDRDDDDREPVSVDELAGAVGVSERTLRTAFSECYRTAPHHFVRLRQLHRAHRALRSADPHVTTVTQVATDLGMCELGKFARDYRMLFGESPSVTLRAGTPVTSGEFGPRRPAPPQGY